MTAPSNPQVQTILLAALTTFRSTESDFDIRNRKEARAAIIDEVKKLTGFTDEQITETIGWMNGHTDEDCSLLIYRASVAAPVFESIPQATK